MRANALYDGILIACTFLVFALLLSFQGACEKEPLPDPVLGFWKNPNNDSQYGWVFYSDGQFGRYVELCPDPEGPLKFYWAGRYVRTTDGMILNDTTTWHMEFSTKDFCRVSTDNGAFVLQREFWGQ